MAGPACWARTTAVAITNATRHPRVRMGLAVLVRHRYYAPGPDMFRRISARGLSPKRPDLWKTGPSPLCGKQARPLLVPDGDHRIEVGRAPRRNQACGHRTDDQ